MRTGSSSARLGLAFLAGLALCGFATQSKAQGTSIGKPLIFGDGIACEASLLPWRSVWFGHFSGGRAYYRRGAPAIALIWQDQKLCFPSRRECLAWQRAEHRHYRQVEGYTTCLRLR
ncbi:MAG TPA: hypothetical protein VIJ06_06620 [Methylovirgula sp.]